MIEITLEKIDLVRERTGVSYSEAKEALEASQGNVVDALIYIENKNKCAANNLYTTKEELVTWLKDLINKGNVTRIRIKKGEKVLVDMPVNAGIAVGVIAAWISAPLLAIGVVGAVVTDLTIEITKQDGSVEVVNKVLKSTVQDVKEKVNDVASDVKEKVNDLASDVKDKFSQRKSGNTNDDENVYKYTVKFEDIDNNEDNK